MKWTVDELIEQALIYAIQDRESYAEACHSGDEYGETASALAKALRKYHAKRYKTEHLNELERMMSQSVSVSIFDLKENSTFGRKPDRV